MSFDIYVVFDNVQRKLKKLVYFKSPFKKMYILMP